MRRRQRKEKGMTRALGRVLLRGAKRTTRTSACGNGPRVTCSVIIITATPSGCWMAQGSTHQGKKRRAVKSSGGSRRAAMELMLWRSRQRWRSRGAVKRRQRRRRKAMMRRRR